MTFTFRVSTPGGQRKSQQHTPKVDFNDWSCGLGDFQSAHASWDGEDINTEGNVERSGHFTLKT